MPEGPIVTTTGGKASLSPKENKGETNTLVGESVAYATKEDVKSSQNLLVLLMVGIVIFVAILGFVYYKFGGRKK